MSGMSPAAYAIVNPPCNGKILNPITDICWKCLLPLSIGSATIMNADVPDSPNPGAPICICPMPLPPWIRVGLSIGWWEPAHLVEVTRSPFCIMHVDLQLPEIVRAAGGSHANNVADEDSVMQSSFYQAHWYQNFYAEWLVDEADTLCREKTLMTAEFMSELDPTWDDDILSNILNPEVVLFANPIAQAACAADCVAAAGGVGTELLFWCAGCHGSMYPLTGNVSHHYGGVQASSMIAARTGFKLARIGALWGAHAHDTVGYCFDHYDPILDKRHYRSQMTYPIPQTSGTCCQPIARSSTLWGSGREFPYKGEDFGYIIWQKRHCCAG